MRRNHEMFMQASFLSEEQINHIKNGSVGTSSGENSDSDYMSDSSAENSNEQQFLQKMVNCTTEKIIWDVETSAPIETEYDIMDIQ